MHGTIYEGRTIQMQYAIRDVVQKKQTNPPSRTLHISNIAYSAGHSELQELFKDLPNLIDVRISIDRRTGLPRGFAHAEFLDVESARVAFESLDGKVLHGRNMRLDYSHTNRRATRTELPDAPTIRRMVT